MDGTSPQGKQQFNIPSSARSLLKDEFADTFDALQEHCAFLDTRIDKLSSKLAALEQILEKERGVIATLEQELAAERVKTRAAEEVRSQFLDNMSHELRTPLNGILGMTQLLLEMPINYEIKDCAQSIHESGKLLEQVISNLLDYSRLLQGDFPLQPAPFNLLEQMESIVQQYALPAAAKGIDLILQLERTLYCTIKADQQRLGQIIDVLLQNAVKFTQEGTVEVAAHIEQEADEYVYVLRITDTGIGIEEALQPMVYEPFWQAERSFTRTYGGMGLGLSLCQQLVHHMGGSIQLTSKPAAGTTVTVRLPVDHIKTLNITPAPTISSLDTIGLYNMRNGHGDSIARYLQWLNLHPVWLDPESFDAETALGCELIIQLHQPLESNDTDPLAHFYASQTRQPLPLRLGITAQNQELTRKEKKAYALLLQQPVLYKQVSNTLAYAGTLWTRLQKQAPETKGLPAAGARRILLVEPNKINQKILSYMLESLNLEVEVRDQMDPDCLPESNINYRAVLINTMITPEPTVELIHEFIRRCQLQDNDSIIGIKSKNATSDPTVFLQAGITRFLSLPTSIDEVRALIL